MFGDSTTDKTQTKRIDELIKAFNSWTEWVGKSVSVLDQNFKYVVKVAEQNQTNIGALNGHIITTKQTITDMQAVDQQFKDRNYFI